MRPYSNIKVVERNSNFMRSPIGSGLGTELFRINLRKAKRRTFNFKYREILKFSDKETDSQQDLTNSLIQLSFPEKITFFLNSPLDLFEKLRKIHQVTTSESISSLLSYPSSLKFLEKYSLPSFSDNISCIVLNIFSKLYSGTTSETILALEILDLNFFLSALSANKPRSFEQILWILGNVAGDISHFRKFLISSQIHTTLIAHLQYFRQFSMLRAASYFVLNICKENSFENADFLQILTFVNELVFESDERVISCGLAALEMMCKGSYEKIQALLNRNSLQRVFALTKSENLEISERSLKVIGNLSFGNSEQIKVLNDFDVLGYLKAAIKSGYGKIWKEALFVLSNLAGDSQESLQKIIVNGFFEEVLQICEVCDQDSRKEASYVFYNASVVASDEQIKQIAGNDLISFVKGALLVQNTECLNNYLCFFTRVLNLWESCNEQRKIEEFESSGILEYFERLEINKRVNPTKA